MDKKLLERLIEDEPGCFKFVDHPEEIDAEFDDGQRRQDTRPPTPGD